MENLTAGGAGRLLSASRDGNFAAALRRVLKSYRRGSRLSINEAAELADMSVRSFQRTLALHGVVFTELADETRAELAVNMLRDRDGSVAEIARDLGYSTHSNFARAFRRWAGMTPAELRSRKRSKEAD